jgi:hypothetical protein
MLSSICPLKHFFVLCCSFKEFLIVHSRLLHFFPRTPGPYQALKSSMEIVEKVISSAVYMYSGFKWTLQNRGVSSVSHTRSFLRCLIHIIFQTLWAEENYFSVLPAVCTSLWLFSTPKMKEAFLSRILSCKNGNEIWEVHEVKASSPARRDVFTGRDI